MNRPLGGPGTDAAAAATPPGAVETTFSGMEPSTSTATIKSSSGPEGDADSSRHGVVDLATVGGPGWVDRVELRRDGGSRCFMRARLKMLAAGGIEDPRLLLSRQVHRNVLGTDHDLVGRFFAERLSPVPGTTSRFPPM
jgi:hypothetical protein